MAQIWSEDESHGSYSRVPWTNRCLFVSKHLTNIKFPPLEVYLGRYQPINISLLIQRQSGIVVKRSGYRASLLGFEYGLNFCLPLDLAQIT